MSIDFWENNTAVVDNLGFKGTIIVTRRERKLLAEGKQIYVDVRGTDGLRRNKAVANLTELPSIEDSTHED